MIGSTLGTGHPTISLVAGSSMHLFGGAQLLRQNCDGKPRYLIT